MVLEVRDVRLNLIDILDVYESLVWTERYNRYGDFELVVIPNHFLLSLLVQDRFITCRELGEMGYIMVIEQVELKTDPQEGNTLIVSGRSSEVVFTRRVIWPVFNKSLKLNDYITQLLNWCFPQTDKDKWVKLNTTINEQEETEFMKTTTITSQHTGDVLYDVLAELCDQFSIGFRINLKRVETTISPGTESERTEEGFEFFTLFYAGIDRSYEQNKNPWVVFSDALNNISTTDDLKSTKELGTVAYIAGEEEQPQRKWTTVQTESVENPFLRREVFVDARDIQSSYRDEEGEEHTIPESDYIKLLKSRGDEKMQNYGRIHEYEANVDSSVEHVYGIDYFLGDIVEIVNQYGQEVRARVTEVIRSDESDGLKIYPTFTIIEEK